MNLNLKKMLKTIILFTYALLLSSTILGQDIIYKIDKTEIKAKVTEITETSVKYFNYEQPNGPIRNINRKDVFMIIYEDGTREVFEEQQSISRASERIDKEDPNINNSKDYSELKRSSLAIGLLAEFGYNPFVAFGFYMSFIAHCLCQHF